MIIVLFLGTRSVKISLGRISHNKIWKMVGFASLVTLGLTLLEISFVSLIELSKLFPEEVEDLESFEELTNNIPGLISIGILTPIEEEIAFRGILVGGLLRMRCNPWVAIVASAVIFAFSHGYHVQFFGTMVFGVVAAWLYWRTKSLIPGIIIHIIHNSVSVVLNMIPFIEPGTEDDTDLSKMTLIIILLVSLSTLAVGLWWFKQKRYRSIKYSNKSQGQN